MLRDLTSDELALVAGAELVQVVNTWCSGGGGDAGFGGWGGFGGFGGGDYGGGDYGGGDYGGGGSDVVGGGGESGGGGSVSILGGGGDFGGAGATGPFNSDTSSPTATVTIEPNGTGPSSSVPAVPQDNSFGYVCSPENFPTDVGTLLDVITFAKGLATANWLDLASGGAGVGKALFECMQKTLAPNSGFDGMIIDFTPNNNFPGSSSVS